VAPLAQPGLLAELPQLLFARNAPLRIVPRMEPAQWLWMLRFLQCCTRARADSSSLALLALGQLSRQETERWLQGTDHAALGFSQRGKLVVLPHAAALAKARAQMAMQAPHGPPQQSVSEDECLRLEPALARMRGRIAGAIHTPSECAIDSLALCRNLETRLRARGVRFMLGNRVHGFHRAQGRVTHIESDAGRHEVDLLVLATGPQSPAVARQLGFSVPVYPLKGYSITVPIRDPDAAPRMNITDAAHKLVYARIGQRLRVAGVVEIRGHDARIDAGRIEALVRHTREAFGEAVDLGEVAAWAGLRPATPDSMPIIARAPLSNVLLNIGQGALGLTLAFGSASRLADLVDRLGSADARAP
ncbi:MAG TPA: FAD-dependent oxidoreductase, partial [Pseudorhodoferax sp.]|nr:FAD-dependent oxidoreductase [Pseudorhodoferax sp.]